MEKKFIRVDEVAKELEISESHAYKIMRKLNREVGGERLYHRCRTSKPSVFQ